MNYNNRLLYTIRYMQNNKPMQPIDIFKFPENVPNARLLIQEAASGEIEDNEFFNYLIDNASNEEDKHIISSIRDDEIKHFKLFNEMYFQLTSKNIAQQANKQFVAPKSYCEGLKRALFGELKAVEKYRYIIYATQSSYHINMLIEIITDEIRHSSLFDYLYTKNNCKE